MNVNQYQTYICILCDDDGDDYSHICVRQMAKRWMNRKLAHISRIYSSINFNGVGHQFCCYVAQWAHFNRTCRGRRRRRRWEQKKIREGRKRRRHGKLLLLLLFALMGHMNRVSRGAITAIENGKYIHIYSMASEFIYRFINFVLRLPIFLPQVTIDVAHTPMWVWLQTSSSVPIDVHQFFSICSVQHRWLAIRQTEWIEYFPFAYALSWRRCPHSWITF